MLPPNLNMSEQDHNVTAHAKVFDAFKSLKKKLLVLHGFSYTDIQYAVFKPDCKYDPEKPDNTKASNDFVAIGENFVLIVMVSDMQENSSTTAEKVRGVFKAKTEHGKQTEELVMEMIKSSNLNVENQPFISTFCAFPNISRKRATEITEKELSRIIFSDDLTTQSNFSAWWDKNAIKAARTPQGIFKYTKEVLTGVWDYLAVSWWGKIVANALNPSEKMMSHLTEILVGLWDINSPDDASWKEDKQN